MKTHVIVVGLLQDASEHDDELHLDLVARDARLPDILEDESDVDRINGSDGFPRRIERKDARQRKPVSDNTGKIQKENKSQLTFQIIGK